MAVETSAKVTFIDLMIPLTGRGFSLDIIILPGVIMVVLVVIVVALEVNLRPGVMIDMLTDT